MKKRTVLIITLVLIAALVSGCVATPVHEKGEDKANADSTVTVETKQNETKNTDVEKAETKPAPAKTDAPTPAENEPKKQSSAVTDKTEYIGEARAKQIALERAGLKESEVKFVKVELERDNGIMEYDVEFKKGMKEYSAEIRADDGKILEWDVDLDD